MKFMKLGSKPDTFQADGKSIRYVSSELLTDVTINVGEVKFYLHKFPLLSKSNCLQKLVSKANEENCDEITVGDFPGGPKAFEICAKFCYGMTVTLNAYNVVAVRCAAEYLEMTEDVDRGNLIFKIEVFLNSSIFRSWKDSIIVLQTAKSLLPWSEDLKIVGRCIDSIASKTSVDPANITWSYTYNRKLSVSDRKAEDGMKLSQRIQSVPKDWWVEDVSELEIDVYKRVIIAVKSKGRMDSTVIGEALETYAVRWLPDLYDGLVADTRTWRYTYIVETLVCLLPSEKHFGCTCGFLLKLLRFAILVGVDDTLRENLVDRISVKLHEASVKDLLIPAQSPQTTLYDVELVQCFVNRNVMHEKYVHCLTIENSEETEDFVLGPELGSLLDVGRLIDGYLVEIAHDPNLSLSSFMDLSKSIPDSARPIHDGIYKAINIFLQEHPNLTKSERKKVCGLIDVKRLTTDACMHAAQNELLPLRVIVQVLFFEQHRVAALNKNAHNASNTTNTDEEWEKAAADDCKSLGKQLSDVKINDEVPKNAKLTKKSSKNHRSGIQLLPSRSRRIFDKLWAVGKGNGENRSSETSGSSQSPTSMIPGDTKSAGSSTRHRRYSIS
ncbi:hypothetical protein K2173_025787 [Erythroxylum novogranatense]|uniref:Phototropic-responsive NPH3 family protein n=1 Tax=Erythroxylum novogranatense TaxID=1862640 RepID=A0AAV8SH93_9ROSI|nr:hypothetical protein K2173_025787 [Erythroxylum novogranatense]